MQRLVVYVCMMFSCLDIIYVCQYMISVCLYIICVLHSIKYMYVIIKWVYVSHSDLNVCDENFANYLLKTKDKIKLHNDSKIIYMNQI